MLASLSTLKQAILLLQLSQSSDTDRAPQRLLKLDDDAAAPSKEALWIGSSTQLFVDNYLVQSSSGLARSMHSPALDHVAVTADAPWERNRTVGMIGTSVIMENGTVRLWYSTRNSTLGCRPAGVLPSHNDQPPCAASDPPQPNFEASAGKIFIGYAESVDGKTFTKPLQHKYELGGSSANNFVAIASPGSNGLAVFVDPKEPADSSRRYRGVSANLAMASPDGLDWSTIGTYDLPKTIPNAGGVNNGSGAFDTQGVILWDPPCDCYSFYTRWDRFDRNHGGPKNAEGGRAVRRARSADLNLTNTTTRETRVGHVGQWVNQSVVMGADVLDTSTHAFGLMDGGPVDYYGSTPWFDEQSGWYWMAAVRFWHWGRPGADQPVTGTKDIVLAASRDGKNFTRVSHEPWLRPGLDGSVGSRQLWMAPPGPVRFGDEELYYVTQANVDEYSGDAIDPKSPHGQWEAEVAVGRLRLHGLVSLDAPYSSASDAAVLTTKPLIYTGTKLLLNLDASGGGSLYIQLHLGDPTGSPVLTSRPLVHNCVDCEVEFWNGVGTPGPINKTAIAVLSGTPVVLVMHMQDCQLYGLRFSAQSLPLHKLEAERSQIKPIKVDDDIETVAHVSAMRTATPLASRKPHIFTFIVDDLGWGNVGYHRADAGLPPIPEVSTPNIDHLARSGIELSRHYAFKSCSPARCSFQTGRLPVHVLDANTVPESFNPNDTVSGFAGIPRNMTTIAWHMKAAGYRTHFVGKWDAGMATPQHTPAGRGYDTGLSYFHHSNDYYTESGDGSACHSGGRPALDIWGTRGPASNFNTSEGRQDNMKNGSLELYEETKFMRSVMGIIATHPKNESLFMTYASHLVHEPLQVPTIYLDRLRPLMLNASGVVDNTNRLWYQAMVACLDDVVGNVTYSLRQAELWDDTFFLLTSDNGGPSYNTAHTANNYPLRGSKLSDWDGGIRVTAFVAGGWVPSAQAGTYRSGLIAIADWYATFCELALVDPSDSAAVAAGLPPVDSLSMVSYLRGERSSSPRTELQPDSNVLLRVDKTNPSRLWKLFGSGFASTPQGATGWACFPGPVYPNATDPGCRSDGNCDRELGGCLFELSSDPTEHVDVAESEGAVLQSMIRRLGALQGSLFTPDRGQKDERACGQVVANGGFYGPWLFLDGGETSL